MSVRKGGVFSFCMRARAQRLAYVLICPHSRFCKRFDEVCAAQEQRADLRLIPLTEVLVELMMKVLEHNDRALILLLLAFPGICHDPVRVCSAQLAHGHAVMRRSKVLESSVTG